MDLRISIVSMTCDIFYSKPGYDNAHNSLYEMDNVFAVITVSEQDIQ